LKLAQGTGFDVYMIDSGQWVFRISGVNLECRSTQFAS
jgi:hypothetical protein